MESKPYSPTRNPIARAIHCIVIAAIVITLTMWTSEYIHTWIDYAAQERQRTLQQARPDTAPTACPRPGTRQ
ncbi:MAG: hypothetical protein OXG49_10005 [Chloroflexi bacterium]|nr:hypothetical protein [Chloroflexota bacterium]